MDKHMVTRARSGCREAAQDSAGSWASHLGVATNHASHMESIPQNHSLFFSPAGTKSQRSHYSISVSGQEEPPNAISRCRLRGGWQASHHCAAVAFLSLPSTRSPR